jgi:hypothetical protein
MAVCNFSYINQLCGQSQILVSQIKVSILQSWRVYETERRTVLGLSWLGLYKGTKKAIYKTPVCRTGSRQRQYWRMRSVVQVRLGEAKAVERCGEAGSLYPDWGKVDTSSVL